MLRSRGRHHPLRFASVVAVLTLGSFASPASAEPMGSSPDGTVDAVVSVADQTSSGVIEKPPKPSPTPSPTPEPTPTPTPTPEPTPTPTPSPAPTPTPTPTPAPAPSPNPTPGAPATTPDPAVTASTGLFGPTSPGASATGGDSRSVPGIGPMDPERAQGGEGSWIQSVASILTQLASIENAPETAESASPCRGSECGSAFDAIGPKVLAIALISVGLAVVGAFAIRARRRRQPERI
jgi:outer membrane biosynthesis protein TonB